MQRKLALESSRLFGALGEDSTRAVSDSPHVELGLWNGLCRTVNVLVKNKCRHAMVFSFRTNVVSETLFTVCQEVALEVLHAAKKRMTVDTMILALGDFLARARTSTRRRGKAPGSRTPPPHDSPPPATVPGKLLLLDSLLHPAISPYACLFNTQIGASMKELNFNTFILAVRLSRKRLVVVLQHNTFIYDVNSITASCYLALPASTSRRSALVYKVSEHELICQIEAHHSPLAAMVFSSKRMYMATASKKGTIVRVHLVAHATKFPRWGVEAYPSTIYSLSVSPSIDLPDVLAATSSSGSLHIHTHYSNRQIPHKSRPKGSFWWKDIMGFVDHYRGITDCKVGNGETVLLWHDMWNGKILMEELPRLYPYARDTNISLQDFNQVSSIQEAFHAPLSVQAFQDWENLIMHSYHQSKGISGTMYGGLPNIQPPPSPFAWIWESKCSEKIKVFSWLLFMDRLNARNILNRKNCQVEGGNYSCVHFNTNVEETAIHVPKSDIEAALQVLNFAIYWKELTEMEECANGGTVDGHGRIGVCEILRFAATAIQGNQRPNLEFCGNEEQKEHFVA
ncbi:hypothetical protein EJB05_01197, partial [Eragrostis curvula]